MGTSLVTVPGKLTLSGSTDRSKEEAASKDLEEKLSRELAEITAELGEATSEIIQMESCLQEKFPTLMTSLEELAQEYVDLLAVKDEGSTEKEQPSPNERSQQHHPEKESVKSSKAKASKGVKDLYRRIALKTHPDKTRHLPREDQDMLTGLFHEAKAAYEAGDLRGLEDIWACVMERKSRLLNRLLARVKALMEGLARAKVELAGLKNSTPYLMSVDYQEVENQAKVEMFYQSMLVRRIEDMKSRIRSLDASRYPPKIVITRTISSLQTSWTTV